MACECRRIVTGHTPRGKPTVLLVNKAKSEQVLRPSVSNRREA